MIKAFVISYDPSPELRTVKSGPGARAEVDPSAESEPERQRKPLLTHLGGSEVEGSRAPPFAVSNQRETLPEGSSASRHSTEPSTNGNL